MRGPWPLSIARSSQPLRELRSLFADLLRGARSTAIAALFAATIAASAQTYDVTKLVPGSAFHGVHGLGIDKSGRLFAGSVAGAALYETLPDLNGPEAHAVLARLALKAGFEFPQYPVVWMMTMMMMSDRTRRTVGKLPANICESVP